MVILELKRQIYKPKIRAFGTTEPVQKTCMVEVRELKFEKIFP